MATTRRRKRRPALVIRAVEVTDAEAITEIMQCANVVAGTLQVPHPTIEGWRQKLEHPPEGMRSLVVERGGKVVAIGSVHPSANPRSHFCGELGMSVLDSAQGQGVGSALLDALLDLSEKWLGLLRLELCVFVDNAPAIALYRSRDFHVEGVMRASTLRDGRLVDSFHMARVAPNLPWPRITAEDVAQRTPPQLPSGPDRGGNGHGEKKGQGKGGFRIS